MRKLTITALILLASVTTYAQDNTLPTTGNVGIGTLNPSSKLDVNGNAIIDSCLLIKDSLQVNKTIRTMGKMFVEQKMTMKGNAVVKQNMRVNGNSRIDGNLRTYGNSRIEGLLKLPNATFLSNNNVNNGNFDFLVLNTNGTAKKIDYDSLVAKIGGGIYNPALNQPCKYEINTPVPSPMWSNGINKIFTSCPQVFVGVGTNSPRVQLDVIGGTGIYSRRITIGNLDPTVYTADFQMKTYHSTTTNPNKELFVVENPDRKLFVIENSGLIRAREIKVDLTTWPDYVFENNYQLMPLPKVENYIQLNGHLPNVPSATEVEENGLSLGEMNKVLLEKIEELTLYLIEQEKRLKEQNERLIELESNL